MTRQNIHFPRSHLPIFLRGPWYFIVPKSVAVERSPDALTCSLCSAPENESYHEFWHPSKASTAPAFHRKSPRFEYFGAMWHHSHQSPSVVAPIESSGRSSQGPSESCERGAACGARISKDLRRWSGDALIKLKPTATRVRRSAEPVIK